MTDEQPTTTTLPGRSCPVCHATLDGISGDGVPAPGDITLCLYCLVYLVLTDDLGLRKLTDGEWIALSPDYRKRLTTVLEHVRKSRRTAGGDQSSSA